MRTKRKGKRMSASAVAKVPVGAVKVHEDADTTVHLDKSNGVLYVTRLEYVTYRLRGPRA